MKKLLVLILPLVYASTASAYYTFQDTGDLLKPGSYAVGGELQFITEDNSGANIIGRFDSGWRDDLNLRGFVGLGEIDFQVGGLIKWVPIPDTDSQPAIGLSGGAMVASYMSNTEVALRLNPFLSKKFEVDFGELTPYVALPLALRTYDGDSSSTSGLVLGTRYIHPDMKGSQFFVELGFDLDDSPTFVGLGATFPLNEDHLIDLWPGED